MSNNLSRQNKPSPKSDFRAYLNDEKFKAEIAKVLPKHMNAERMTRVALTASQKNPKLIDCSQDSFAQAMLTCSEIGLEPDGRLAYLIPYGKTCTLVIGYKGFVSLAMRSGKISTIHADTVCEEDTFLYQMGQVNDHTVDFRKDRGKPFAYYVIVTMKDGSRRCDVMSVADAIRIRDRSQGYMSAIKYGSDNPWISDFDEMAKKTVFRRLSKWLDLSSEYRKALDHDDTDFVVEGKVSGRNVRSSSSVVAMLDDLRDSPTEADNEPVKAETVSKRLDDAKAVYAHKDAIMKAISVSSLSKVAAAIEADPSLNDDSRKMLHEEVESLLEVLESQAD